MSGRAFCGVVSLIGGCLGVLSGVFSMIFGCRSVLSVGNFL